MRFMMLMISKGYETAETGAKPTAETGAKPTAETGAKPTAEMFAAMFKYNESLRKAGVLLALEGLHPPATGARISFAGGNAKVTDGPFAEAKEVLGGYWVIQVKSRDEAIEWAKRCPATENATIEVRQVGEFSEFPDDVKAAATNFPELRAWKAAAVAGS